MLFIIGDYQDGKEGRMLWQGSASAYAKIFNMKPKQIVSKGSQITDPKSGCLKDIKMDIINAVVGFHLLCSCEFLN